MLISLDGSGGIGEIGTYQDLTHGGGYTQTLVQTGVEATLAESSNEPGSAQGEVAKKEHKAKEKKEVDDKRRQLGDRTVYTYYFGSVGIVFVATLLFLEVGWAFLQCFPSMSPICFARNRNIALKPTANVMIAVWLNFWASAVQNDPGTPAGRYLGIYAALQVLGIFWFALLIW